MNNLRLFLILSVLIALGENVTYAQTPYFKWAKQAGGSDYDVGNSIAADGSGNIIVTGHYESTANFSTTTLNSAGERDVFIVKYDASGNVLWAKQAGGTYFDVGYDVATDGSGNSIVVGYFGETATFGTISLTSTGSQDIFIAKYDASGNVLWAKQAGGTGFDKGCGISTDISGNIFITGKFKHSATFGTIKLTGAGDTDIFIAKYNTSGNVLWAKHAGGSDFDKGYSISTDSFGNSIITGIFQNIATFGTISLTSAGGYDIFIAKYNTSGDLLWAKKAGGTGYDTGHCVATDGSGNSIVTGKFENVATFGTTSLTSAGGWEIFIAKYDASGNVNWVKRAGGTSYEYAKGITTDGSNNIFITGYFSSVATATFDTIELTSVGNNDIFVAKYNTSGEALWAKQAGGTNADYGYNITTDGLGNSIITGVFKETANFGTIPLNSIGNSDIFIAKLAEGSKPSVTTNSASEISSISATLNGLVNPYGDTTTVRFQYGTTVSYGSDITATPSSLNGTSNVSVSAQLTGLTSNQTYHYRVVATNNVGTSYGEDRTFTTTAIAPTLSSPSDGSTGISTSLTLAWNVSSGATSYGLQISPSSNFSTILFDSSGLDTTSKTITGLSSNTTFYWRVNATNEGGTSDWSSIWTFTTIIKIPSKPTLFSPANDSTGISTSPTLLWNASSGITSYRLQVSTQSNFTTTVLDQSGIATTSKALTNLNTNTIYYWRVNASNAGGTSDWSVIWNFTTSSLPPTVPILSSPSDGATGIKTNPTLSWNTSSGATSYQLQVSTSSNFSTIKFDQSGITTTSKAITEISTNTTYYWRVNATNAGGTSGWSNIWNFTTIVAPPLAPTLSSPSDDTTGVSTSLTLIWNASSEATSYQLQVSTIEGFSTTIFDQSGLTTTSKAIDGLSTDTTYYWRLNATNAGGTSDWSSIWDFETSGVASTGPIPYSPSDGMTGVSTTPTLTWDALSGALSYRLQVSTSYDFVANVLDQSGITTTSKLVPDLSNNTTYYWHVNATIVGGTSDWSSTYSFTTSVIAPVAPTLSSPSNELTGVSKSPTLVWDASTGATSYYLQVSGSSSFSTTVVDKSGIATTSKAITDLNTNTTYFWRVNATNAGGTNDWSSIWSFTTAGIHLSAPTLNSPEDGTTIESTIPKFEWIKPNDARLYYRLQISVNSDFDITLFDNWEITSTVKQITETLDTEATYFWHVNATNESGETSEWSSMWSFKTIIEKPEAPTLYSPSDGSMEILSSSPLQWNASSNAISYRIQVATDLNFSQLEIDSSGFSATIMQITGLDNDITYYWRVNATNAGGTSDWSRVWNFKTVVAPPASPMLDSPADGSMGVPTIPKPTLTWEVINDAESYKLLVSTSSDFSTKFGNHTVAAVTYKQIADSTLNTNTTYYWKVNATNAGGTSDWSSSWSFTTILASPSLSFPLNETEDVDTSTTLKWDAPSGAESYRLQVSNDQYLNKVLIDMSGITSTSVIINGLANNSKYFWHINASNACGTSSWSSIWNFTTKKTIHLETTISTPNFNNPSEYSQTDFKIIGLPGVSNIRIDTLLSGTQGKDWQVFWDNGVESNDPKDYLIEFDGMPIFRFSIGRAFWLIKKGSFIISREVSAASLNESGLVAIPLHNGWNLITNPFLAPVNWSTVKDKNNIPDSYPLWRYEGTGGFIESDVLESYIGYYIDAPVGMSSLKIPYPHSLPKISVPNGNAESISWRVRIELSSGNFIDRTLSFGVSSKASRGRDRFDFRKPRAIATMPQISFQHPEWDNNLSEFATDIRPEFEKMECWDFEVRGANKKSSQLTFNGIGEIPEHFEVYLIDNGRGKYINMRDKSNYDFIAIGNISKFCVIIGRTDAVQEQLSEVHPPTKFSLGKNYPNPFNPLTTIPVAIPVRSKIKLRIYNILGEQVKTIYSGILEPGGYLFSWDGKDDRGNNLAAGIYLSYFTDSTGITLSCKMLFIK